MKPSGVLLFLLVVMAGLGLLGALMPASGLHLGGSLTLDLPSPREMLFPKEEEKVDISDILAVTTDSAAVLEPETLLDSLGYDSVAANIPFSFDSTKLRPL